LLPLGCVGRHHGTFDTLMPQRANLTQGNILLSLKADLFRHFRLSASLDIISPVLRKLQLIPHRKSGLLSGERIYF
jgi:hypothetical protein